MSDKKRRDIALGDLKAGCKLTAQNDIKACDKCEFSAVCSDMGFGIAPAFWKLTDPPRFNEQQMALLKALYASGVVKIAFGTTNDLLRCLDAERDMAAGLFWEKIGLPREELDLAELIGKESNEK